MQLKFSVPDGDMDLAGIGSTTLKKKLQQIGVDNAIIKKTVIALYEAEINMVIHGGGGDITIDVDPNEIVCVLEDHGPGIADLSLAMQEGYSTATDAIREMGFGAGMGLPNIKKYTDEMIIESEVGKGTTVKICVKIKKD